MNITINKDTPIEQLIEYLKVNRQNINDCIANSLLSNFKTVGDIYNLKYQELSTLPDISKGYSSRLATIFIINDYSNSRHSNLVSSLSNCYTAHPNHRVLEQSVYYENFKYWLEHQDYKTDSERYRFSTFVEFLDELNQQSKQETNVNKPSEQPDDKSFRLIQKLLEIWNDDVEQQVEDIINRSR